MLITNFYDIISSSMSENTYSIQLNLVLVAQDDTLYKTCNSCAIACPYQRTCEANAGGENSSFIHIK